MKLAYTAYDQAGRSVSGTIESTDTVTATESLRRQGLFVADIDTSRDQSAAKTSARRRRSGSLKEVTVFTRQLCVLLASGTPLVDAVSALTRQLRPGPWRETVKSLRQGVEEGLSLTEAMEAFPSVFDSVYCSLVAAGESSGQLPEMLDRLATYKQKQMRVRNTVVGALIYPSMLILLAVNMFAMLLIFIIPRFATLFATMNVPLPTSTRVLVALSTVFRQWWWLILLVLGGGSVGSLFYLASERGRRVRDKLYLKMPYLGFITRGFATARIVRLLSVLLAGHVPLLKALALIRNCAGNVYYSDLVARAEELVAKGEPLHVAFGDTPLISPSVHEAIRSGESSGRIDELLTNMADFMEDDNETIVRSLTTLIEPVILIFMGILVGAIAVSMFMPLFDLTAMTGGGK